MSNTNPIPDTTSTQALETIEPTLIPLFEAPSEWFQDPYEQYNLSAGGVGTIADLTPHGVMFSCLKDVCHQGAHF